MPVSVLTSKWQTTLYLVEGKRVVLKPLKGNILELRGSVTTKEKPVDFKMLRDTTRKKIARKIIEEAQ
jgi:hypothetical protein